MIYGLLAGFILTRSVAMLNFTRGRDLSGVIALCVLMTFSAATRADEPRSPWIRSDQNGSWSEAKTWEAGKIPDANSRVHIRAGHAVVYDIKSDLAIRAIHVGGTLSFARDRDTRLDVGLIRIEAADEPSEDGAECDAHFAEPDLKKPRPALEVGTPDNPIDAKRTALIRLVRFPNTDKDALPAIVCCAGRMDFHGTPMNRTWVKLDATAKPGDVVVCLMEPVTGWKVGDRVIVTATSYQTYKKSLGTEERFIAAIDGDKVTLDRPLEVEHLGVGLTRGEVANLSRNVVVESADPKERGHTMYHRNSAGAISYAEFRGLGKQGVLGRYALHYHLVGDTMRGSYVIGASIWDSGNRWLTIHGANDLVIRDNVGYKSVGHGFFFEDGTEVRNVVDRNLAVGARPGKRLPKQVLPFDANEGAGFWWANSHNAFTRNIAVDNGEYGFRYEATASKSFPLVLPVQQSDGKRVRVDIRTLPFIRFDDNETHSNSGHYGVNLGEGVAGVGPDARHPFVVRNLLVWNTHYGFRPQVPSLLVEKMSLLGTVYGVYHPNFDNHVYRNVTINGDGSEPFNRGHDDISNQTGRLTVDGLTFENTKGSPNSIPLIQISDDNTTGKAESHFRNLKVVRHDPKNLRTVLDTGGGAHVTPKTEHGVPVFLHDYFGPGRHAKVAATNAKDFAADGLDYRVEKPFLGHEAKIAEVKDLTFPELLDPVDDVPPSTAITHVRRTEPGKILVRGTTADNGTVTKVFVNGQEAKATRPNFAEWEIVLDAATDPVEISAHAVDAAGNLEKRPHRVIR